MDSIIKVLSEQVANQIAAGEVIQRPASVVKELVENSLDAGSSQIDIVIEEAGRDLIQVIDDGKGMSRDDAVICFSRHATSKISSASDLFDLQTRGFRGEALASIAAVAQVTLRTCPKGEDIGTEVHVEGSSVVSEEEVSCPYGTNFQVRNLFYNVPARRKFLKSNSTEMSNILAEFERIALVNENVGFSILHNNMELHKLFPSMLKQRIVDVFGKKMRETLLPVNADTEICRIHGFVAKPEGARKKGAHQFFFVNGRYMRHPYFHKAVMEAYKGIIPEGEQVDYFIYFEQDPASIDVNVHPTKTEIKFEKEGSIWPILMAAVRETIGKFSDVPTIDFDMADCPDIPAYDRSKSAAASSQMPKVHVDPSYNPFDRHSKGAGISEHTTHSQWEPVFENLRRSDSLKEYQTWSSNVEPGPAGNDLFKPSADSAKYYVQHKGRYIVTSMRSGLMVIDQNRAHIRILYEKFLNMIKERKCASQKLLFPERVELSCSEAQAVEECMDDLNYAGFEISSLGGNSFSINGIPVLSEDMDPVSFFHSLVSDLSESTQTVRSSRQESLALMMAKKAAVEPGKWLSQEEMGDIVSQLLVLQTPNYTPDGKLVIKMMRDDDIDKMF